MINMDGTNFAKSTIIGDKNIRSNQFADSVNIIGDNLIEIID